MPGLDVTSCAWTQDRFPISVDVEHADAAAGPLGLALRANPRRAQLLVTAALAKHVPVAPSVPLAAVSALASLVRETGWVGPDTLVVGLAETATGLAELLACELGIVDAVASTRHPTPPGVRALSFDEPHSHARGHRLQPTDPTLLTRRRTLVLVDDEVTSGSTLVHLVDALRAVSGVRRIVVACLVDARPDGGSGPLAELGARGVDVRVCCLARVAVRVGPDAVARVRDALPQLPASDRGEGEGSWQRLDVPRPAAWLRDGVRRADLAGRPGLAQTIAGLLPDPQGLRVDVLGIEEQMALPVLVADAVHRRGAAAVTVHATTRTPALVVDDPGYPLRAAVRWGTADGSRAAYNTPTGAELTVVVADGDEEPSPHLLRVLGGHVVVLRWVT